MTREYLSIPIRLVTPFRGELDFPARCSHFVLLGVRAYDVGGALLGRRLIVTAGDITLIDVALSPAAVGLLRAKLVFPGTQLSVHITGEDKPVARVLLEGLFSGTTDDDD